MGERETLLSAFIDGFKQPFRLLTLPFKRRCIHEFRGVDLPPRDADGMIRWPCSKCGEVFAMQYGLDAPGHILGPWTQPEPPQ